jgi:protein-tyrosine phosphatase
MDKVFWVIDGMLCGRPGPAQDPWDIKDLYNGNIRSIVSLDLDNVDYKSIVEAGINHVAFTLPDSIPPTEDDAKLWLEVLPKSFNYIKGQLANNEGAVMVHCYAGKDRTGMLLGSFLTLIQGFDPKEAFSKLRAVRPVALSSQGYEEFFFELMNRIQCQI